MRTIVTNSEVAHLWANQSQSEASNASGSIYFRDSTIYSYGSHFPMARHVDGVVLITNDSYSITTGKHLSLVRYAANHLQCFHVDNVLANTKSLHRENLAAMKAAYEYTLLKASRARTTAPWLLEQAERDLITANEYSAFFKLTTRIKPADITSIRARADKQAKAAKAARIKADKKRIKQYAEHIARWRAHESVYFNLYGADVALRLIENGDTVESSKGARFPSCHAIRSIPLVKQCKATGTAWKRNGENIRLGHYQIDSIGKNGDVKAGCHFVKYAEVLHLEALLA